MKGITRNWPWALTLGLFVGLGLCQSGCGWSSAVEDVEASVEQAAGDASGGPLVTTAAKPLGRPDYIVVPPAPKRLSAPPDGALALPADQIAEEAATAGGAATPLLLPADMDTAPLTLPAGLVADEVSVADTPADIQQRLNPLRSAAAPGTWLAAAAESEKTSVLGMTVAESDKPSASETVAARSEEKAPPKRKGKHSGVPFDPIKENGPIFEGWPKPSLALVITGRQDGYLEPCGCAGLDRMKGGMARRHTLFRTLRDQGWPVVGLDVGGIAKGFGKQAELKFQTSVEGMRRMGYDAVAFGASDLKLPAGELVAVAASADGKSSMFLSADVGLFGFEAGVTPKSKIIARPGAKLAVTAVLGRQFQKQVHNDEVEMIDPEKAIAAILPELKKQAGYLVLLAHATREESIELAKRFPDFNLVVTAGGPAEPPAKLEVIEGTKTILVQVGEKGMNAVVIAYFDDPTIRVRYQRVPLDSRFAISEEMVTLMRAYQDQIKTLGFEGLNIRAVPHPQRETNGRFVGSEKCASCHEESMRVWKRTGHARAFETLERLDPPRHHDPECISCHVVGWHPTKFFPYESGFVSKEKTPELIDTGCEDCHGPGEKHVAAETGSDVELQRRLQKAMVVTKEESSKRQCYTCHDLDNSPDFDFESYWPIVEHYEE